MSKRKIAIAASLVFALAVVVGVKAYDKSGSASLYHMFGDPYPRIVTQAFAYVDRQYVEPNRAVPAKLLEGAFRGLETRFPPVRIDLDQTSSKATVKVGEALKVVPTGAATTLDGVAKVLNEALEFIASELGSDMKKEDVYYAALNGAVSELDPHSNAINPSQFKEFMIGTRGSFGGIGFVFGIRDGEMAIISPIEGTPAARGGLRSGDRIVMIDGEPTINMPVDIAASKMRGEPGTEVTLTISRTGWNEPRPFTFIREIINVESVESYTLKNDGRAPTLYLRVKNFQKDTADELKEAIQDAQAKNPDLAGIILDLRNNPGGLLDQAIELSDGFMDRGVIVSTRGRDSESQTRSEAESDRPVSDLPLTLLINQGSASASEIVSGALRSYRALLIGTKTFGKGSVQKLFPLPDNGALKLTVAQYLTANDVSIQSIGIQPDVMVYPAVVSEKELRIGPPVEHMGEADLKNAFTEWGNSSEKPWRELQYLKTEESDAMEGGGDEEGGLPRKSFAELTLDEKLDRLKKDFPIDLARRILARVPEEKRRRADRETLMKIAAPVIDEVAVEQEARVAATLEKVGVNWGQGKPDGDPALKVTIQTPKEFKAGETGKVSVTVRNVGTASARRVWGRTDSKDPFITGRDLVFGTIEPGAEKSWQIPVEIPKSITSRWDPVKVDLNVGGKKLEDVGDGSALLRADGKPDFAYTFELTEKNDVPALSGNGVLDPGDLVDLSLAVENIGQGAGKAVEVNIRGEGQEVIKLKAARNRLENFEPGQVRQAPMSFKLEKADEEGNVKVDVSITDVDHNAIMTDELKFKVGKPFTARERRALPTIKMGDLPPLRTSNAQIKVSAQIEDESGVKEVYAYLGDKKVYYQKSGEGKRKVDAKFTVELKPGSNFLVLAAGDNQELVARRTFVVYLAESGPELALNQKRKAARATDVR